MNYINSWDNDTRSASYAKLEFPNTYHLAYRDLPEIAKSHAKGIKTLDFGCGTGRSSRFFKKQGFDVTGIDISPSMIRQAVEKDPGGTYILAKDGNYNDIPNDFDLITSIFTFDNIPAQKRLLILSGLKQKLSRRGCIIMLDSNPELYRNEWASFSTAPFAGNRTAKTGDPVYTIMNDVEDKTPVEDYFFTEQDYLKLFEEAGMKLLKRYAPLGSKDESFTWKSELTIAPWIIYVLGV